MYINQVIESADRLCPNEYTLKEKYIWCDELSAMLTQEYNKRYERVRLEADKDGTYLLPEDVTFEMIDRVLDGRYMIEKQDFRSFGVIYLSGLRRRIALPDRHRVKDYIDVVYIKKHKPIRDIELENVKIHCLDLSRASSGFSMINSPFKAGDILEIKIKEEKLFKEMTLDNVYVMETETTDDQMTEIITNDGAFNDVWRTTTSAGGETVTDGDIEINIGAMSAARLYATADIKRHVLEKTVCDAPYDSMYIDYVNAKICYFQHDYESYNQHMTMFNSRLLAYQAWLKEREPTGDDGKLKNWF